MGILACLCFGIAGLVIGLSVFVNYMSSKGEKEIVLYTTKDGEKKTVDVEQAKKHAPIWGIAALILGLMFLLIGHHDQA
jgi:hypothetical protein